MTRTKILFTLLIMPLVFFSGPISGEQRLSGGWIDSYDGPAGAYRLQRGDQEIPVAIYAPVYVGDQITVDKGHALFIGKSDGTMLKIDSASQVYTVREADESVTLLDNFLQWAGAWFGKYTGGEQNIEVVSVVSRRDDSTPISMSLFPTGQARMLQGRRAVSLYWEGGQPPFGFRIYDQDNSRLVASREGLESGRAVIGPLDFHVGSYNLEVYDKDWIEIVRLNVVPRNLYPEKPAEIENASMPEDVMRNLEAMWLASQDDGIWMLEAYQMVADEDSAISAAALLRRAFEEGIAPTR